MDNDEILKSIGSLIMAIDQKFERLLQTKEKSQVEMLGEMRAFFDQLAREVTSQFIGDLPRAIELLEKKIDLFDHDLTDGLRGFSDTLIQYENKLEERIKKEIQALEEQLIHRLDFHQREQTEKLEELCRAVNNLGSGINMLGKAINNLNSEIFNPALDRLEEILSQYLADKKGKFTLFHKK